MKEHAIPFDPGLKGLGAAQWTERLGEIGFSLGRSVTLGDAHTAVAINAGPNLIVTFEEGRKLRRKNADPRGFEYTRRDGWSSLSILATEHSWFRDPAIYQFIDELSDDGYFDAFDNVLFYGEQAGGYAACAYSVAAPGSTVLALAPVATLNPRVAVFDPRAAKHKRHDFTSRYGYAPDMIDAAKQVFIVHDPMRQLETQHANLFIRDNVTLLRSFGLNQHIESAFEELDILEDIIRAAMAGSLNEVVFADQYRCRRDHAPYLFALIERAQAAGHHRLAAQASAVANRLHDAPNLKAQQATLSDQGQVAMMARG